MHRTIEFSLSTCKEDRHLRCCAPMTFRVSDKCNGSARGVLCKILFVVNICKSDNFIMFIEHMVGTSAVIVAEHDCWVCIRVGSAYFFNL